MEGELGWEEAAGEASHRVDLYLAPALEGLRIDLGALEGLEYEAPGESSHRAVLGALEDLAREAAGEDR